MDFEYNHEKSEINREKHGIHFEEARYLWDDDYHRIIDAHGSDEPRFMIIAKYRGKHWSAICTHRSHDVRIISVRRSRKKEVDHYEQAKKAAQH